MIKDLKYLAKGKRSIVYTGNFKRRKVVMKVEKKTQAQNRIQNEINFLKILNRHNIGPKLIEEGEDYFLCEFIEGKLILDYISEENKVKIKRVIVEVMKQCRAMDKLKIDKKEMHYPVKHIIIGKKVRMIDFERCRKTLTPKNVTQFGQFLMSKKVNDLLKKKGISIDKKDLQKLLKEYKKGYKESLFKKIIAVITERF